MAEEVPPEPPTNDMPDEVPADETAPIVTQNEIPLPPPPPPAGDE